MRTMARPSICTASAESLGGIGASLGVTSQNVYPAANDALFVPLAISRPALAKRMFSVNGSAVAGNIDLGIYSADGARIVSIGSTAQAGTTALQFFDITDAYLSPGQYYMAVACSSGSARLARYNVTIIRQQQWGVLKMATAFPLPAVATFATVTATFIPLIGMELMGVL